MAESGCGIAGLRAFLERAKLEEYLKEAKAFCSGCGAIDVAEVLEDAELRRELADHLQLRSLEHRRYEAVAEALVDEADYAVEDPAPAVAASAVASAAVLGASRAAPVPPQDVEGRRQAPAASAPFGGTGWNARRRGGSGGGRGKGAATRSVHHGGPCGGHYFEAAALEADVVEEAQPRGGHYFDAPDLQPLSTGDDASGRRPASGGYFQQDGRSERSCEGSSREDLLLNFQPFFDTVEVVTHAQRAIAAAFLDDNGATSMEDLVIYDLSEAFTAALELKPVPRAKAIRFWRDLFGPAASLSTSGAPRGAPRGPPRGSAEVSRLDEAAARNPTWGSTPGVRPGGAGGHHYFDAARAVAEAAAAPSASAETAVFTEDIASPHPATRGIGAHVRSSEGELWGRVVADGGRVWKLASGRSARKDTEGLKWSWDEEAPARGGGLEPLERQASVLDALAEKKRQDEEALASKRTVARQRRREQDDERRVDPEDDRAYTLRDLMQRYRGTFPEAEIQRYWQEDCALIGRAEPCTALPSSLPSSCASPPPAPARHRRKSRSSADAAAAAESLRRVDPDDGRAYTYEELQRKYNPAFSEREISAYWREECRPY